MDSKKKVTLKIGLYFLLLLVPMANAEKSINASHGAAASVDEYVYIQGKYYKKRDDNIYMINGKKVYYLNNRKVSSTTSGTVSAGAVGSSTQNQSRGGGN